ncbi:hypothetical protein TNCV_4107521 [Trichonephila clavipes]|nr:hypothetical protein TNCV_4107521 [Trichonephila clavipes]
MFKTSVPAVHSMSDTLEKIVQRLNVEPIFNSSLYLITIGILPFLHYFVELTKDEVVSWREVQAVSERLSGIAVTQVRHATAT